jgi:hypothetical protein
MVSQCKGIHIAGARDIAGVYPGVACIPVKQLA